MKLHCFRNYQIKHPFVYIVCVFSLFSCGLTSHIIQLRFHGLNYKHCITNTFNTRGCLITLTWQNLNYEKHNQHFSSPSPLATKYCCIQITQSHRLCLYIVATTINGQSTWPTFSCQIFPLIFFSNSYKLPHCTLST